MRFFIFVSMCTLLTGRCVLANEDYDFNEVEQHALKAIESNYAPSISMAISKDGQIIYEQAFGYADVEAKVKATPRTAYILASATKPITATAAMLLVERHKMELDAPAEKYLHPLRFVDSRGTEQKPSLAQLLSHTSGLGTYARIHFGDEITAAPSLDAEFARYGVLVQVPGRVSEYSNLGYGLIGKAIARQSKQSFASFVQDAIFTPLHMNDSFIDSPGERRIAIAAKYGTSKERLPALLNNTPGAGNAYASAHDLVRFGMFHLNADNDAVLSRPSIQRMQANADPRALQHYYADSYYGLGWYVRPSDSGYRVVWHEGGMPGSSTIIKLLPQQHIAVAVLANRTDINELTQSIADELIHAVVKGYKPQPLNPIANYAPYFAQPEFVGRWTGKIAVDGTDLLCTLTLSNEGKGTIRYVDKRNSTPVTEATFQAKVNGDSLISAFEGTLPARNMPKSSQPLLLVKLVRSGKRLDGALVAYASPQRLEYLSPFAITLERDEDS